MALIKCYECEKEISDKALACPHCGAPKKKAAPSTEPEPLATKDEGFNKVVAIAVGAKDDAEDVDLLMTKLFEFDLRGTYLKVIGGIGSEPDMSLILYLQRNGRFLFLGYYPGYEKSVAAGRGTGRPFTW